ncbi:HypC/HybG/HupF family hydrogenase formation chaperone [Accumulibacter sp.]|uniref:HypC/HybG/HupF family hydrogenase formation chaperone n=1 Tax=Candidatus Accumulibacter proximus TaxID=2954385 RepID=A0A935UHL6_9PROT|nr:HypC/HybG/HupF family hydrogenase formation chaperone [Accumulibacter sp.]MBK7675608.1 HypC/HybG/HupF family hydrogenase formation chaperone [Candidatus Accumulibacter proximus]MBL8375587.1 HypC/HybG/HupF family hydrogenase formation chaperone [Accumulibacter sp.]
MCLSIPMQLVALEGRNGDFAVAERRQGDTLRRERINLMLIGPQPVGTWVLASLGLAREVLEDGERKLIEDALAAVSAALTGDYDPARHFADLTSKPADPGEPP